jgi:hypothetical protein
MVDCRGEESATLAAWSSRDDATWFFKLGGPVGVVDAQKARFIEFVKSIEFLTR